MLISPTLLLLLTMQEKHCKYSKRVFLSSHSLYVEPGNVDLVKKRKEKKRKEKKRKRKRGRKKKKKGRKNKRKKKELLKACK